MAVPTRVGYTVARFVFDAGPQTHSLAIPAGTQAGDHMIVFAEWGGGLPSGLTGNGDWPEGWQQIMYKNHNTRGYALWYAGKYTSGSSLTITFKALASQDAKFSLAVVRGGVDFSDWVIGNWWDRTGLGGNVMNTTTRALSVVAPANSLVLSFHGEATNVMETSANSVTGATKWYESNPQTADYVDIERHYVTYHETTAYEATPVVDVIWPNNAQNGAAMQIAIPESVPKHAAIKGAIGFRRSSGDSPTLIDISKVPVGGWMVVSVMTSASSATVTPPAGWSALHAAETTGTRRNFFFGKVKDAADGDTAQFIDAATSVSLSYGFTWGTGAADIAYWQVGVAGRRYETTDPIGARYTTIAPSITTGYNNSLVLTISHEATLALGDSYEITSYTPGWQETIWFPQEAPSDRIETIWVGSKVMAIAGQTGDAQIVYRNPQDYNGWAIQLEIPSATALADATVPYVVESVEAKSVAQGPSLTFTKPASLQDGDMLVAILRGQSSTAAADWTALDSIWTRVGPTWPGASPQRLNTQLVRYVEKATEEPSTYTFTRMVNDTNRRVGHLIVLRSKDGVPQVSAWDPTYSGEDPAGAVDRSTLPYAIQTPSIEILWGASEFASPQDHAIANRPIGFQDIRYTTTSEDTGISRTTLYSAYRTHGSGTSTEAAGIDWLGTTSGAAAGSITFITGAPPDMSGEGYLLKNGQGQDVRVYYTKETGVRTPSAVLPMRRGFNTVAEVLATPGTTWAHRGGSVSYPEHSLYGYTQSVLRGYGVLEVSLGRTSDGVWFGLHDQTTDRTSGGTYGNASSQTWAQIQAQQIVVGPGAPQPYMRWDELVAAYGSTHILVVDPKYALGSYRTEFLNMVYNDIGPTRAIIKYSGSGSGATGLATAAKNMGFETWGFFYAPDASAAQGGNGNLQTWGPYWTTIGMDYTAPQAVWDEALALGKPVIGHIAPSQAAYNTAIAKGAIGVQVSGVGAVAPVSWWTQ